MMKKVRITAVRKASYPDLMEKYENPIQHACVKRLSRSLVVIADSRNN